MLFGKKPKPINAESLATIEAIENGPAKFSAKPAYSGGVLKVAGYRNGIVIDLAGLVSHRKVIANLDHDSSKRVGHIVNATNDGKTLSLDGALSASTPFRDEVVGSHQDGFGWDVSVEILPNKIERVEAGQSISVNGQTFQGPIEVARTSTLYGLAFVGAGADEANSVRIAAMEGDVTVTEEEQTFESWAMSHEFDLTSMSEQELAVLQSIYDKQSKASEPISASFDANFIRGEVDRSFRSIEAAVLKYEDMVKPEKLAEIKAEALDKIRALKAKAGEHEYTGVKFQFEASPIIAATHLALIRAERPQGPSIHSSSKDSSMNPEVIQASLHIASGREDVALKAFGEQTTEAARKSGPRSYLEAAECCIRASGAEVPRDRNEMLKMALRPILGTFSNLNLPTILSNTMGRSLEMAFLEGTASWRPFATIKSAANFKPQTSVRPSSAGNLQQVAPNGELKHQVIGEEATYPWRIGTWGTIETINRQVIIDDDLSYINERPTMNGIAAARTLNDLVWQTIMSYSFANTAALALTIDNLVSAVATMKVQKDSKGNSIDFSPSALAVPPQLEGAARQALRSTELVHGAAGQGNANPAFGIVPNLCVEPRLSNNKFTNFDVDAWYLFGGPMSSAVIVGYLNNQQTPTIETEAAEFNTLGMSLRCYHDFGVAMGDGKASLRSNP